MRSLHRWLARPHPPERPPAPRRRSYQALVLVGLPLIMAILAAITLDVAVPQPDRVLVTTLGSYVMLVLNLPWALLAWQFPDPVEEELPIQA